MTVCSESAAKSARSYIHQILQRCRRAANGTRAKRRCCSGVNGPSMRGVIQIGERWNTVSCSTSCAIAGTYWIALAPVPIDATRSPASGLLWSQRAEWNVRPRKRSAPGISGIDGTLSMPRPLTSTSAWNVSPDSARSSHRRSLSCHVASTTAVFVRTCGRTPNWSVQRSR